MNYYEIIWIFAWIFSHILWDYLTKLQLNFFYPLEELPEKISKKRKKNFLIFLILLPIYLIWKILNIINTLRNKFFMRTWSFFEKNILSSIFLFLNFILYFYLIKNNYFLFLSEEINTLISNKNIIILLVFISVILSFYVFSIWLKKISKINKLLIEIVKLIFLNMSVILFLSVLFYYLWLFNSV